MKPEIIKLIEENPELPVVPMVDSSELKPCAFCGGKGHVSGREVRYIGQNDYGSKKIYYGVQVICGRCKARGPLVTETVVFGHGANEVIAEMESKAIEFWNGRSEK